MFYLIWINGWVNNREAGDLRRHRTRYDVTVMLEAWDSCHLENSLPQFWYICIIHRMFHYRHMCYNWLHYRNNSPPWWRHNIEALFALLAFCEGNRPVTGRFPLQRAIASGAIFDDFFDFSVNKLLNTHSSHGWFKTSWRPGYVTVMPYSFLNFVVTVLYYRALYTAIYRESMVLVQFIIITMTS